jgi:hypothetical protein
MEIVLVSGSRKYWASSDDTHETTVIASPVLFPLYTGQFPPQISAPLFLCSLLLFLIERIDRQKVWKHEVWKHARKDQQQAELSRSVLCESSARAASYQRSCHSVGATNSVFRRLTRPRTSYRSCHHALPFLPVIHPSAHGLHSCEPTWPPPTWITAIQVNSRAPWYAARHHRRLAIMELGALGSQFGRRLLLMTSRHQPRPWI